MGLFERIFGYKKSQQNNVNTQEESLPSEPQNENAIRLLECGRFIDSLLSADKYVPRSEYLGTISEYSSDIDFLLS